MSKNIVMAALVTLTLSTAAFADDSSVETLNVSGDQAGALMTALEGIGAQNYSVPDASFLNVDNLNCMSGFVIGHGPVSKCTATQQVHGPFGTHFIKLVKLSAKGEKVTTLINALEDAGVKGTNFIEYSVYKVNSIRCSHALFAGPHGNFGKSCEITVDRE
jgi:hypothetical protein